METWVHDLRFRLPRPPPAAVIGAADDAWGWHPPHMRYNMDQTGVQLDSNANGSTWATADERSKDMVRIATVKSGSMRFATLQLALSADLIQPQPKVRRG